VAFFAGVKASSFCIHLSCLACIQSVVRGVWSHLFYGHIAVLPPGYSSSVMLCHLSVAIRRCSHRKYIENATDGGVNGESSDTTVC